MILQNSIPGLYNPPFGTAQIHSRSKRFKCKTDSGLEWWSAIRSWLPHLVGVVRQVADGCGQAALGRQQVSILAHLLGQQDADGSRAGLLGLLHSTPQHHHFLHQVLTTH